MSLDGFTTGPDDSMEWAFVYPEAENRLADEEMRSTGAILAGRRWYDVATERYNGRQGIYGGKWEGPVFVLTHRADDHDVSDPGITLLTGDLEDAVRDGEGRRRRQEPRDLRRQHRRPVPRPRRDRRDRGPHRARVPRRRRSPLWRGRQPRPGSARARGPGRGRRATESALPRQALVAAGVDVEIVDRPGAEPD